LTTTQLTTKTLFFKTTEVPKTEVSKTTEAPKTTGASKTGLCPGGQLPLKDAQGLLIDCSNASWYNYFLIKKM
jgi:hypothetical protein